MKITRVQTFIVDGGFRPWSFVKIETSEPGLIGWGDCSDWGAPGPVTATVAHLAELIIGRDPMQVEAIWWDLAAASIRHNGGIAWKAMAGIDSALWDIRGKALNAPVWQLLGGKLRDELRLYWSHCGSTRSSHAELLGLPPCQTSDDLRRLAEEVLERGYTAVKTNLMPLRDRPGDHLELGRFSPETGDAPPQVLRNALAITGTLREALGPDVDIALDVAFWFRPGGAIKLARALEPHALMWLEVETFDADALQLVRNSTRTPICTGESLYGQQGFLPFLQRRSQDIIMPDLSWNGITMGKKLADLAHAHETLFAPHNCHSPLATLIAAQVCATVPNFFILEFDVDDAPWRDDLLTRLLEIRDGRLQVPQGPGLGADLIEEELLKHPPGDYPWAR